MSVKYMHLLSGHPAYFVEEQKQIFYCSHGVRLDEILVDSLAEIRRHQKVSERTRSGDGYAPHTKVYGYLRVKTQD